MQQIVKTLFGSHLYGTDTENSDIDYKGVYIPASDDIILGSYDKSINRSTKPEGQLKNSKEDIDTEIFSLDKFISLLCQGQMVALDLAFTPDKCILEKDPLWDYFLDNRDKFLTSKITSYVGYCRNQANKYGIKGSRVASARKVYEFWENKYDSGYMYPISKVRDFLTCTNNGILQNYPEVDNLYKDEFINYCTIVQADGRVNEYMEVCGRKIDYNAPAKTALTLSKKLLDEYGQRALQAETNKGIDWKALSHAVRALYQAKELLQDHTITFPLKECDQLRDIKLGKYDYKDVAKIIEDGFVELEELQDKCTLPKEVDPVFKREFILDIYRDHIVNKGNG